MEQPLIEITPAAQDKLLQLLAEKKQDLAGLLLGIKRRGPAGFEYFMRFVPAGDRPQEAVSFAAGGLTVFIENQDAENLKGAVVNFSPTRGGFHIENPNPAWAWEDPVAQSVQNVLTDQINPAIAAHGGWVQLLDVKEGVAYIELGGGCVGCGLVDVTLKQGIEVAIKQAVPAIQAVVDRTDHASGTNPYYQASKADPYQQPAKGEPAPRSPFG